jgi:hypothetical protein
LRDVYARFKKANREEVSLMEPTADMDKIIKTIKQSPNEYEIINHFKQFPKACETVQDIAENLKKSPDEIENAVLNLEELGILHNCGPIWGSPDYAGKYTEFYALSRELELKSIIKMMN